jgi:4'-phosphopantetheinyl transferase
MMVEDSRFLLGALDRHENALTPLERSRAAGRRGTDRLDYVAAHLLVRICAARLTRVPPWSLVIGQRCPGCDATDHGRPFVRGRPGLSVSLSHTAGTVAAAAGWSAVGVDVEATTGFVFDRRLAERALGPEEAAAVRAAPDPALAFLRRWVRKEALVKAGHGALLTPMTEESSAAVAGWRTHEWTAEGGGAFAAAVSQQPLTLLRAVDRPYGQPISDYRPEGL